MPGSSRRSIIAIVGLACSIVFWPHDGAVAQYPDGQGVTQGTPAVESQGVGKASQSQQGPGNFSIPVRIIENPGDAEHTEEREQKSDQHDHDDLIAQQQAAKAATVSAQQSRNQTRFAKWQTVIAALGTLAVLYSLWLTREALKVAQNAIAVSERAWIKTEMIAESDFKSYRAGGPALSIAAINRNIGNAPALNAHTLIEPASTIGEVADVVRKVSGKAIADHKTSYGLTVLPDDRYERPWSVSFDDGPPQKALFFPAIVCCVTYESPHDKVLHQTCSVFIVRGKKGTRAEYIAYEDVVAREDIGFDPWTGGFAN